MKLILSRVETARQQALAKVDQLFADDIQAMLGPMQHLHALKAAAAASGDMTLFDDEGDRQASLSNAAASNARLALVDQRRRSFKRRIRDCTSSAEIEAVLVEVRLDNGSLNG
ncbi:hypothetical protein NA8A_04125 [Nitratireductor indicus C115]|uniref:Uncharacterized protein n=1 Tax=Nitratireductor indicus C115 TaxID=1231190 RepID=K2PSB7_9HYPH|nr:hypothetical protein [Nitratireductor indicus]EKF43967.1 hypothetical protein NA8A_04125 [Nitratireductor indicus C115]SFQ13143.1 hypothetical protein SAMN05216176_101490 [Nitratireductor indicus]